MQADEVCKALDVSPARAKAIVRLCSGELNPERFSFLPFYRRNLWHHTDTPLLKAGVVMDCINYLMQWKAFGVESVEVGNRLALYVNTGDTYNATIVYDDDTCEYLLTSWGDWYEHAEQESAGF